ncbi:MAG: Prephenate dehydratase [Actinomycetia bacterium]|nr:Prephenate dehydratase [Actinomycetes bacterium]
MSSTKLVTLGGPGTFAAQATTNIQRRFPRFAGTVEYRPTVDAVWTSLDDGDADYVVLGAHTQRTGFASELHTRLRFDRSPLVYVVAEAIVPYECRLLVRAGTRMQDVRRVLGHGSLAQCIPYLEAHLPDAERVRHPKSSFEAAREVVAGDGTLALVGTASIAIDAGLVTLAEDIDGGARAAWWVMGRAEEVDSTIDHLIIAGLFSQRGDLGDIIAGLVGLGLRLRSCSSSPHGTALFDADTVLQLEGTCALSDARRIVERAPAARIAGAFTG